MFHTPAMQVESFKCFLDGLTTSHPIAGHMEAAAQGRPVRRHMAVSYWLWTSGLRYLSCLQGSSQERLSQLQWGREPQPRGPQLCLEQMWLLQLWAQKERCIPGGAAKLVHAAATVPKPIHPLRRNYLREIIHRRARGQAHSYVVRTVSPNLVGGQLGYHHYRHLWVDSLWSKYSFVPVWPLMYTKKASSMVYIRKSFVHGIGLIYITLTCVHLPISVWTSVMLCAWMRCSDGAYYLETITKWFKPFLTFWHYSLVCRTSLYNTLIRFGVLHVLCWRTKLQNVLDGMMKDR